MPSCSSASRRDGAAARRPWPPSPARCRARCGSPWLRHRAAPRLHVRIDVVAGHLPPAAAVPVDQQFVQVAAAPTQQRADRVQQDRVVNALGTSDARLGDVLEDQLPMLSADMLAAQRRQAVGAVRFRRRSARRSGNAPRPAAETRCRAVAPPASPVAVRCSATMFRARGSAAPSSSTRLVLLPVPVGLPVRVVQVLASSRGIGAHRLQVTVGVRGDPDVLPRRRNHQGLDPSSEGLVGDHGAIGVQVGPALPRRRRVSPRWPGWVRRSRGT